MLNGGRVPHAPVGVIIDQGVQLLLCALHTKCDTTSRTRPRTTLPRPPPMKDKT